MSNHSNSFGVILLTDKQTDTGENTEVICRLCGAANVFSGSTDRPVHDDSPCYVALSSSGICAVLSALPKRKGERDFVEQAEIDRRSNRSETRSARFCQITSCKKTHPLLVCHLKCGFDWQCLVARAAGIRACLRLLTAAVALGHCILRYRILYHWRRLNRTMHRHSAPSFIIRRLVDVPNLQNE